MSLSDIRKEIDEIDEKLVPLFVRRLQCSEQIAEYKIEHDLPIFNPEREIQILNKVGKNSGEYDTEARMLYTIMMSISRMRQHKLMNTGSETRTLITDALTRSIDLHELPEDTIVTCVGEGSYGNEAANYLFPSYKKTFLKNHKEVFRNLEDGSADIGILPVENSSAGSVAEVYDLIMKFRYSIIAATTVQVNHCLAAPEEATLDSIKTVISHPQALSQCSDTVNKFQLKPIQDNNTATAAGRVAKENDPAIAVICSEYAANRYGLKILKSNIQNNQHNRTRFIAVKKTMEIPKEANKISICFSLYHATGSLYSVLSKFSMNGLNLTKIESRPAKNIANNFRYNFYLDFTGSVKDEKTLDLLCQLSEELENFSFLGNYIEN